MADPSGKNLDGHRFDKGENGTPWCQCQGADRVRSHPRQQAAAVERDLDLDGMGRAVLGKAAHGSENHVVDADTGRHFRRDDDLARRYAYAQRLAFPGGNQR